MSSWAQGALVISRLSQIFFHKIDAILLGRKVLVSRSHSSLTPHRQRLTWLNCRVYLARKYCSRIQLQCFRSACEQHPCKLSHPVGTIPFTVCRKSTFGTSWHHPWRKCSGTPQAKLNKSGEPTPKRTSSSYLRKHSAKFPNARTRQGLNTPWPRHSTRTCLDTTLKGTRMYKNQQLFLSCPSNTANTNFPLTNFPPNALLSRKKKKAQQRIATGNPSPTEDSLHKCTRWDHHEPALHTIRHDTNTRAHQKKITKYT